MFYALQFENDRIFYYDVDAVSTIKVDSFVGNRQRDLPLELDSMEMQFMAQTLFISRLE